MPKVEIQPSKEISAFLTKQIELGNFPSAVYLVAEQGEIQFADALGLAVKMPSAIPAHYTTIYDLASLTKPLVTALLCTKAIESGKFALDNKISKYFSEFDRADKREITILDLITHVSGFPSWKPFYLSARPKDQSPKLTVLSAIADEKLENPPQTKVKYSDFNFLMLGFLLETLYGMGLDLIAKQEIFDKLKLECTFFNPSIELRKEIAASEFGSNYEKQTCRELGFQVEQLRASPSAFRNSLIWGEVHDGNAWFLNGVAGHAGLFSNAEEVFKIALQFLPDSSISLKAETCKLFYTNFTENLNEARSFGFELAATEKSTASDALAKDSFGHLGFTGTSLWIEPETARIFILLTNRTHRPLPFVNINSTRRTFHQLATKLLNKI